MNYLKIFAAFILLTFMSCNTSRITSSWKAENPAPKKFSKIMVVSLVKETDRTMRERMEEHLIGDLKELGYNAVSAYQEYGPKAFDNMNEETVLNKLKNSGVDAVITIVLLDKTKEQYYVAARVRHTPYAVYHNRFYGYYNTLYERVYTPGYYEVSTRYFWESNLYDLGTKDLLYSAQTETFDPASTEMLGHEYGKLIVKNMVSQNVLTKQ